MKGHFKQTKKKETPIGALTHSRLNHAVICGTLAGACAQIQDAARIAGETAQRARTILDTPELRAYLTGVESATLELMLKHCEGSADILRVDYALIYAIEQRVRRINAPADLPSSGHSTAPAKKKSLSSVGKKDFRK